MQFSRPLPSTASPEPAGEPPPAGAAEPVLEEKVEDLPPPAHPHVPARSGGFAVFTVFYAMALAALGLAFHATPHGPLLTFLTAALAVSTLPAMVLAMRRIRRLSQRLYGARRGADLARRRLTDVLESLPLGVACYDKEDRLVVFNEMYRSLMGFAPIARGDTYETVLAKSQNYLRPGILPARRLDIFAEMVRRHRDLQQTPAATIERPFPDGRWRAFSAQPARDGGVISMVADVTARQEAAALRGEAERVAAQALMRERQLTQGLGAMLDDIAQRVARDERPAGLVRLAAGALSHILSGREAEGGDAVPLQAFSLAALLEDVNARLSPALGEARIGMRLMLDARMPAFVEGDAEHLGYWLEMLVAGIALGYAPRHLGLQVGMMEERLSLAVIGYELARAPEDDAGRSLLFTWLRAAFAGEGGQLDRLALRQKALSVTLTLPWKAVPAPEAQRSAAKPAGNKPVGADRFDMLVEELGAAAVERLVGLFEREFARRTEALTPESDAARLSAEAHALKGGALSLGLEEVARLLREIERLDEAPLPLAEVDALLARLAREAPPAMAGLRRRLGRGLSEEDPA